jgi:8-oxo-dGTP pyrophosphatase MutT (NUDIX family)
MTRHELLSDADPRLAQSDDVATALEIVCSAPESDEAVTAARSQIVDLVTGSIAPAHRATRPGHLTGSAFVLSADGRRTILLFHRKLQRWLQPGGHADGDTNLAAVALREATEETGIVGLRVDPVPVDLDIHEVRPPNEDPHLHLDVRFVVVAPEGSRPVGNEESEAIRWVEVDRLAEMGVDAGLLRLAAAAQARMTDF